MSMAIWSPTLWTPYARLKQGGFSRIEDNQSEPGGRFLVGYADRLFSIQDDYRVVESTHDFNSCGCGEDIGLGSLTTAHITDPRSACARPSGVSLGMGVMTEDNWRHQTADERLGAVPAMGDGYRERERWRLSLLDGLDRPRRFAGPAGLVHSRSGTDFGLWDPRVTRRRSDPVWPDVTRKKTQVNQWVTNPTKMPRSVNS